MTTKQRKAAQRNIQKAQKVARSKKTITNLSGKVRSELGREGAKAARRGGRTGHSYEDRTRTELYEQAKKAGIAGRSKMGKGELIQALRRS